MWYVTYNIATREIDRMDNFKMVIDESIFNTVEVEDDDLPDDIFNRMSVYKVDENEHFYIDETLVEEYELDILRTKREPLLKAFDIYKSNLIIGAISLSEEEKQQVITWYNLILDLDADAINNPPEVLSKYIQ